MATEQPEALQSSALGSKAYWDDAYKREIHNHAANPSDEGTIWFEDSGAEEEMIEYIEMKILDSSNPNRIKTQFNGPARILDLGTGNGHLLFALQDLNLNLRLVGVDYSSSSIELARTIQASRDDACQSIQFEVCDIFAGTDNSWMIHGFDVVLDKGTFDAISLSATPVREDGKQGWELYGECVTNFLRPGAFFLVTSCNWTEEELRKWIESPDLEFHDRVSYPSFSFGGIRGQSVSTVCFKRPLRDKL